MLRGFGLRASWIRSRQASWSDSLNHCRLRILLFLQYVVSVQWPPDRERTSHDRPKNLAREYALHFTNTGTCGASNGLPSSNHAHPHVFKKTASSVAVANSVALNGNGNGHASFDEEEESHSHPRGFFADQFEVRPTHPCHQTIYERGMTPFPEPQ